MGLENDRFTIPSFGLPVRICLTVPLALVVSTPPKKCAKSVKRVSTGGLVTSIWLRGLEKAHRPSKSLFNKASLLLF
jgi:hypothetical protein